ncbi:MAG: hypothetical protein RID53_26275 [Coleofasciculus sp. B1-GNL1-01]|uniref:hypothetical protein n=1 Tax=Coleofasciculus sp. B1-GNL1-01 TaxID=3068484 RepID=UPI0032FAFCF5
MPYFTVDPGFISLWGIVVRNPGNSPYFGRTHSVPESRHAIGNGFAIIQQNRNPIYRRTHFHKMKVYQKKARSLFGLREESAIA